MVAKAKWIGRSVNCGNAIIPINMSTFVFGYSLYSDPLSYFFLFSAFVSLLLFLASEW